MQISSVKMYIAAYCLLDEIFQTYIDATTDTTLNGAEAPGAWIGRNNDTLVALTPDEVDSDEAPGVTPYINSNNPKETSYVATMYKNITYSAVVAHIFENSSISVPPTTHPDTTLWKKTTIDAIDYVVPKSAIGQPLKLRIWCEVTFGTETQNYTVKLAPQDITLGAGTWYNFTTSKQVQYMPNTGVITTPNGVISGTADTFQISHIDASLYLWDRIANTADFAVTSNTNVRGICYYIYIYDETWQVADFVQLPTGITLTRTLCNAMEMGGNLFTVTTGNYQQYYPTCTTRIRLNSNVSLTLPATLYGGEAITGYALCAILQDAYHIANNGLLYYQGYEYLLSEPWDVELAAPEFSIEKRSWALLWRPGDGIGYTCDIHGSFRAPVTIATGFTIDSVSSFIPAGAETDIYAYNPLSLTWTRSTMPVESDINLYFSNIPITLTSNESIGLTFPLTGNPAVLSDTALYHTSTATLMLRVPVTYLIEYTHDGVIGSTEIHGWYYFNIGRGITATCNNNSIVHDIYDERVITGAEITMKMPVYSATDWDAAHGDFNPNYGWGRNQIYTMGYGNATFANTSNESISPGTGTPYVQSKFNLTGVIDLRGAESPVSIDIGYRDDQMPTHNTSVIFDVINYSFTSQTYASVILNYPLNIDGDVHMNATATLIVEE